jgi:hypothetical protein
VRLRDQVTQAVDAPRPLAHQVTPASAPQPDLGVELAMNSMLVSPAMKGRGA